MIASNLDRARIAKKAQISFKTSIVEISNEKPLIEAYRNAMKEAIDTFKRSEAIVMPKSWEAKPQEVLQTLLCYLRHFADFTLLDREAFPDFVQMSQKIMTTVQDCAQLTADQAPPLMYHDMALFLAGLRLWASEHCLVQNLETGREQRCDTPAFNLLDWRAEGMYREDCEEEDRNSPRRATIVCDNGATMRIARHLRSTTTWPISVLDVDMVRERQYNRSGDVDIIETDPGVILLAFDRHKSIRIEVDPAKVVVMSYNSKTQVRSDQVGIGTGQANYPSMALIEHEVLTRYTAHLDSVQKVQRNQETARQTPPSARRRPG